MANFLPLLLREFLAREWGGTFWEEGGTFWEEGRACCINLEFPEPDGLSKMADASLAGLEVVGLERRSAEGKCPQGLSIVGSVDLLGAEAGSQGGGWGSGSPDRDREMTGRAELGCGHSTDGAGRGLGESVQRSSPPPFLSTLPLPWIITIVP